MNNEQKEVKDAWIQQLHPTNGCLGFVILMFLCAVLMKACDIYTSTH